METEQNPQEIQEEQNLTQEKLPNATTSIVLSIIGYICCCFSMGIGGLILSWIGLFLANKDKKSYEENPEKYSNFSQVKTARILAIIGLVLGGIALIMVIVNIISAGGWDAYVDKFREAIQKIKEAQAQQKP